MCICSSKPACLQVGAYGHILYLDARVFRRTQSSINLVLECLCVHQQVYSERWHGSIVHYAPSQLLALGTEGQRETEGSPIGLSPHTQAEIQGGDWKKEAVRESERCIDQERLARKRDKARRKGEVKQIWQKEGMEREKNNANKGKMEKTGDKKEKRQSTKRQGVRGGRYGEMKRGREDRWALKRRTRWGISFLIERASVHQPFTVWSQRLIEMFHFWQTGEQNERPMMEAWNICHLHKAPPRSTHKHHTRVKALAITRTQTLLMRTFNTQAKPLPKTIHQLYGADSGRNESICPI